MELIRKFAEHNLVSSSHILPGKSLSGRSVRWNGKDHRCLPLNEGVLLGDAEGSCLVARTFITYEMAGGLQRECFDKAKLDITDGLTKMQRARQMPWVKWLTVATLCVLLTACKTQERVVTVERVRTDKAYISRTVRDSVYVQDSTHVRERYIGDTVWVEVTRWNRVVRDGTRVDTVYRARVDSVPRPYPVEVEVPALITPWQRWRMKMGDAAMIVTAVALVWVLVRRRLRL